MVYALLCATILFTVVGQVLVKIGMLEVGPMPGDPSLWPRFGFLAFTHLKVAAGLLLAVPAALCWMGALSRASLSFAYPFMALSIVLVLVASSLFLGDAIPPLRWIGVALVCAGIVLVARS